MSSFFFAWIPFSFAFSWGGTPLLSGLLCLVPNAANLRKEVAALLDQWVEENSAAMLARWLMDQREQPGRASESVPVADPLSDARQAGSDNFLTDRNAAKPIMHPAAGQRIPL